MNTQWNDMIARATGAQSAQRGEVIQSLWSGYGEIVRYGLVGADMPSVVLKHVRFPSKSIIHAAGTMITAISAR